MQCNGQDKKGWKNTNNDQIVNSQDKIRILVKDSQSVRWFCRNRRVNINEFLSLNPTINEEDILNEGEIVYIPIPIKWGRTIRPPRPYNGEITNPTSKTVTGGVSASGLAGEGKLPNKDGKSTTTTGKETAKITSLDPNNLFKEIIFRNKQYHLCEIDPQQYKIELFNKVENGKDVYNFSSLSAKKQGKLLFAMNGGMFQSDLSPVGLFISENKQVKDINLSVGPDDNFHMRPNGIFGLDSNDKPFIYPSEEYKGNKNIRLATQSGPMLVINNTYHEKLTPGSPNVKIRNGVGINKQGHVLFIVSDDPVNFYELAELFKEQLNCKDALYLDGVVSQYFIPSIQQKPRPGVKLGPILTVSRK
ncbi:hypothetical protein GCM10028805_55550 [Spirosoma harenae]